MGKNKICRVIYRFWHTKSKRGRVGYIGKDTYHPLRYDLRARKKVPGYRKLYRALHKYPMKYWRKEVLESGFKSDKALNRAEIKWIAYFDSKNKGYNCTDGGEGCAGAIWTKASRERLSKSLLALDRPPKIVTKAVREKIRKALLGHPVSPETRAKISKVCKGRIVISEERKQELRENFTGKGNPFYGRKHTPEMIRHFIKIHTGVKMSAATRKRMSISQRKWRAERRKEQEDAK